jgi:predicted DNA-binding transcriptional regulator AlpA
MFFKGKSEYALTSSRGVTPKMRRNSPWNHSSGSSYWGLSDNSTLSDRNHTSWAGRAMYFDRPFRRTLGHATVTSADVPLSRWVNERLPPWNEVLTSHDVARLTRRHRWIVTALSLVGGFPKKRQFCGRPIGWLRADVEEWLGRRGLAHRPSAPCRRQPADPQRSHSVRDRHGYRRNLR